MIPETDRDDIPMRLCTYPVWYIYIFFRRGRHAGKIRKGMIYSQATSKTSAIWIAADIDRQEIPRRLILGESGPGDVGRCSVEINSMA
jgi:hypothetical protein